MEKLGLKNSIKQVKAAISTAIKTAVNVDEPNAPVNIKLNDSQGDYMTAFAQKIFNAHKKKNQAIADLGSPDALAKAVAEELKKNTDTFAKVEAVDKGFVWLTLSDNILQNSVRSILDNGPVLEQAENPQKMLCDFSSPNIAKEMHVGHLRSTILGDSISRVLEYNGHSVLRVNHLGDWGTQFGMLICNLFENYPNWMNEMPDISDLEKFYRESKVLFDQDPEFKKRAQETVVKLQGGDATCLEAWKLICAESKKCFDEIYTRLDIDVSPYGESYYNAMIPSVLEELQAKKLAVEDQGALCVFVDKKKPPLIVRKKDGGFNYDTTDMAAAKYRLVDLKLDRCIYVTDVGQYPHFESIFKGAEMAGWHDPKKRPKWTIWALGLF